MDGGLLNILKTAGFELQTDWGSYYVRPPSVRTVLLVLLLAPTACSDDSDEVELHRSLEDWLPLDLRAGLLELVPEKVLEFLNDTLALTRPDIPPRESEFEPDDFENPADWIDLLADYGRCYGQTLTEVLSEPWPSFMLFADKMSQVYAREQYRAIEATGLPYIQDEGEKQDAYDSLRDRAKLPRLTVEAEKRMKLKRQREVLKNNPFTHSTIAVKKDVKANTRF